MSLLPLHTSDGELVRRVLRDRDGAFEKLVFRYQKKAWAIARAVGLRGDLVDDAVQESFLRAIEKLPKLRDPSRFGPWFLAIVRNTSRRLLSRESTRATAELRPNDGLRSDSPDRDLASREMNQKLWEQVERLSPAAREVVWLYYQDGQRIGEIARALGISRGAVKTRLSQARSVLREGLWRELGGTLRDMLPSTREWNRKGRALTLLVSTVSVDWLARARVAATLAPSAGTAGSLGSLAGSEAARSTLGTTLSIMSQKTTIATTLSVLLLASGGGFIWWQSRPRDLTPATSEMLAKPTDGAERRESLPGRDRSVTIGREQRYTPTRDADRNPATEGTPRRLEGRVLSRNGAPVEGARVLAVELTRWLDWARSMRDTGADRDQLREHSLEVPLSGEAESGPDGRFSLSFETPKALRLIVGHAEFRPAYLDVLDPLQSKEQRVELTAAWTLSGRVVDSRGEGLAGFEIVAQAVRSSSDPLDGILESYLALERGFLLLAKPIVSGEDGSFTVPSLDAGEYELSANSAALPPIVHSGIAAGRDDVRLVVDRGWTVQGRVVSASDQEPLADALISLFWLGAVEEAGVKETGEASRVLAAKSSTGGDGAFALENVPSGPYLLTATAESHAVLRETLHVMPLPDATAETDTEPADTERRRAVLDLEELALERALPLAGRVLDVGGRPIAGVTVSTRVLSPSDPIAWAASSRSDAEGRFRLEGLAPGRYDLITEHDAWAAADLRADAGRVDIELRLEPGRRLVGRVLDVAGLPVEGAAVEIETTRAHADQHIPLPKPTRSGRDGSFELVGISGRLTGKRVLRASHPQFGVTTTSVRLPADDEDQITLDFEDSEKLRGRVLDASGEPVPDALVRLATRRRRGEMVDAGRRTWDRTGSDGEFALSAAAREISSRDRRSVVVVSSPNHATSWLAIDNPHGDAWPELELVAEPGVGLAGRVLDSNGTPVEGVLVDARSLLPSEDGFAAAALSPGRRTVTAADGSFAVRHIAVGIASLRLSTPESADTIFSIEVPPGGKDDLELWLDRGIELEGRVVDSTGEPIQGARVTARNIVTSDPAPEPTVRRARTNSDGHYAFERLPTGEYSISATAREHAEAELSTLDVDLDPDLRDRTSLPDLVLRPFASIAGRVRGAPPPGAKPGSETETLPAFHIRVTRRDPDAPVEEKPNPFGGGEWVGSGRFRDAQGRYRLGKLPAGHFTARCEAKGYLSRALPVELEEGEAAHIDFQLTRGGAVKGRVRSAVDDAAVVGALVGLYLDGEPFPHETRTDLQGRFTVEGLEAGTYRVRISHRWFRSPAEPTSVEVRLGERSDVDIAARPAGGHRIQLANLVWHGEVDGRPVSYIHMAKIERLVEKDGRLVRKHYGASIIHENRDLSLSALAPGRYAVTIQRRAHGVEQDSVSPTQSVGEVEVEVRAGQTGESRFTLPD